MRKRSRGETRRGRRRWPCLKPGSRLLTRTEALALYRVQSPIQMILYSESDASDNA